MGNAATVAIIAMVGVAGNATGLGGIPTRKIGKTPMLTPEQREARRHGIGASEAAIILSGDYYDLWRIKTGRLQEPDLSWNFAVRLGETTEALNLNWYSHSVGRPVTRRGESCVYKRLPFIRATIDGFDEGLRGPVQAKHCGAFVKPADVLVRYTPQVMHEMIVTGTEKAILSVIYGTNEPVFDLVEFDEFFAADYIRRCAEFWEYVVSDREPPGAPALAPPEGPKLMRKVDMASSNSWAEWAPKWLENKAAAATFKDAEKELKALVEPDVGEAFGHGIRVTRNKAGALSIKGV